MLRVVMHGCNSGSALRVNAEFDSMGGVVDGGDGIGLKTSLSRVAIEKAQAELRQEYDVREERRKQLEFLEKGGNPLDFKFGAAASVSVQSTSLTDQHHEQFGTSEAKGSFALTASPHGDSVDSSARPGAPFSELNTADNLLLFDGENELLEGKKRSLHSNKRHNIAPPEQCSQIGVSQNAKETEDCAIVRPYARRNRSRLNHGPRGGSRDGKGLVSDTNKQKNHIVPPSSKPKNASVNGDILIKDPVSNDMVGVEAHETASGSASVPEDKLDITFNRNIKGDQRILPCQDDTAQKPVFSASGEANAVEERDPGASTDIDPLPFVASTQPGNEFCCGLPNGLDNLKLDKKGVPNEGQNSSAALGMKNFDSESSCVQTSLAKDVNDDNMCTNRKNVDENGNTMQETLESERKINLTACEVVKERNMTNCGESGATADFEHGTGYLDCSGNGNMVKIEEDINIYSACMQNKVNDSSNEDSAILKAAKKDSIVVNRSNSVKENNYEKTQLPVDGSISETIQTALAEKVTAAAPDCRPCSTQHLKLAAKAHEDSILEEAQIIKVKRKRIAELSVCTLLTQVRQNSHWDFVLEEMAWLANDFAQERLWKLSAAAQLCHRASITSRLRVEKQNKLLGRKILCHSMAKAVMQFWHSAELLLDNDASGDKRINSDMKKSKYSEGQNHRKSTTLKVHAYALKFLKDSRSHGIPYQAETPTTPNKISDSGTVDMSWEDHLTEENLFYTVPPTAMEVYRKSVESHFLHFEKTGSNIQRRVETSTYDTIAEFGSEELAYVEDEGEETGTYYLPGVFEGIKSSKSAQKKHKNRMKSYTHKSSEVGTDLAYVHYTGGTQPSVIFGKRPASLNVGAIPTKRIRTASRQRVVSPFAVASGTVQAQAKTDASSGDTNSFQDHHISLHVGSQIQKSVEGESVGDFEKQLLYDCGETSVKTKKKPKTMGCAYDQGWQLDSVALNEQRDHSKKRLDNYHFESNGSSGLYGQPKVKKLKIVKQSLDNSSDNIAPTTNSIPSPAASQMSNMSNQNKLIRIFSGRDRGKKTKGLKVSSGQPDSGTLWSLFEDQALVVLVHDMGPNWELISDVINSTLQFKFIYRRPNECKERHKILMDRSVGDGADSAEDSGSSQSYPSTLPGIPKGSAMQLFQRLQGPMEEDTLKSHFDKIIKIGKKQQYLRNQNDNQDSKQLVPIHNSHVIALSQVFPNNLNGGVLTPLDLCDTNATSPDGITNGYQVSHAGGLGLSNHGSQPSVHPTSGSISSISASSGMSLGISLSSPSAPTAAFIRDSKYGVPRTSPLTVDEQQRIHYNQMISARNLQQSSMSVPGSLSGNDRGVYMLPAGSGTGMVGGNNRNIAASRPGFQGMASPSMHGSGGVLSSSTVGVPSPVHLHSGVVTGQGNSSPRPREAVHMRTGHNQEHQRQMVVPESQMQAAQGNCQGNPAFNNQTNSPHAKRPQQQSNLSNSRPLHQGLNHVTNSQQQAHAIRMAKERQLRQQQRYRQHHQQFATSSVMIPHVQVQSHLPLSSPIQNSSPAKPQNSSQQVSLPAVKSSSPSTSMSSQQQHHLPQHGLSRKPAAGGLTTQAVKLQQQAYQQPGRQHLNQPLHAQSLQQAKLVKGIGRGNMLVHQNPAVDPSHLNGLSVPPGSQSAEIGYQIMHMAQGQNLHHQTQPSKPLGPSYSSNHSQLQQKLHSVPANKQLQSAVSPSESSIQGQASPVPASHIISAPHPASTADNHHQLKQQSQPQSKQINQTQPNVQGVLQKNCHVHSESLTMPQSDSPQVDQQPVNNAPRVNTSTMSPGCIDSDSAVTVVPTVSAQWKTSERPFDSDTPDPVTHVSSLGGAAVGNSAGNELPTINQGLGPQQLPVSFPSHAHNSGVQQHPPPLQRQPSSQPIQSRQQYQPAELHKQQQLEQQHEQHSPKDVDLQHQPQQKVQHLQPGQNCLPVRPPCSIEE